MYAYKIGFCNLQNIITFQKYSTEITLILQNIYL